MQDSTTKKCSFGTLPHGHQPVAAAIQPAADVGTLQGDGGRHDGQESGESQYIAESRVNGQRLLDAETFDLREGDEEHGEEKEQQRQQQELHSLVDVRQASPFEPIVMEVLSAHADGRDGDQEGHPHGQTRLPEGPGEVRAVFAEGCAGAVNAISPEPHHLHLILVGACKPVVHGKGLREEDDAYAHQRNGQHDGQVRQVQGVAAHHIASVEHHR